MLQAGGWVMVELAISFAAISALVAAVISLLCLLRIGKAGRSESITKELMIQLFREERERGSQNPLRMKLEQREKSLPSHCFHPSGP
jgi:hypothetical protein